MPTTTDNDQPTVRIGTWNVAWAEADSERGARVADALKAPDCDIVCVTEGRADILPPDGHIVDAGPDWGCGREETRRKVLVWSRQPWAAADIGSCGALPGGRLVAGITLTALGPLTVVGVCIPWRDAHVCSGRRNRSQWQEHEAWLAGFESLPYRHAKRRTVVLGDFNQRVPRRSQPEEVHAALLHALRVSASRRPGAWRVRRAGLSITSPIRRTWSRPAASGCGLGMTSMTVVFPTASEYGATSPSARVQGGSRDGHDDRRAIAAGSVPDRRVRWLPFPNRRPPGGMTEFREE